MNTNTKKLPRILIAATKSGSGKTMFTCGLLQLLKNRGLDPAAFKCGPDYIDPMFHRSVMGLSSGNLDTFFCSHEQVRSILASCEKESAVIEGVMGIYDGLGGICTEASCYDVAAAADTPVLLVADAYGSGRTVISMLKGILEDDKKHLIKGIVLNRVSSAFYSRIAPQAEDELHKAGFDVRLLGFLPKLKSISITGRRLGLMLPEEIDGLQQQFNDLAAAISEYCDIDGILSVMLSAPELTALPSRRPKQTGEKLRLAVAHDEAFCFFYRENLQLFESFGIELVPFSPVHDRLLPDNIHGLLLGGGYPELLLDELERNTSMRESIRLAINNGLPSLAECGGFMYLHEFITDATGNARSMVGVIPGTCTDSGHLTRFGYVTLNTKQTAGKINDLAKALDRMKGHEFHYFDSSNNGCDIMLTKPCSSMSWNGMHTGSDHIWGFPHLYYASNPEFVRIFSEVMRNGRK